MILNVKVKGMHCPSCEELIKDGVRALAGIQDITVSHRTGAVKVAFDDKKTNAAAIRSAIKQEGYEVA
jgi:copper chaperone CopZ